MSGQRVRLRCHFCGASTRHFCAATPDGYHAFVEFSNRFTKPCLSGGLSPERRWMVLYPDKQRLHFDV